MCIFLVNKDIMSKTVVSSGLSSSVTKVHFNTACINLVSYVLNRDMGKLFRINCFGSTQLCRFLTIHESNPVCIPYQITERNNTYFDIYTHLPGIKRTTFYILIWSRNISVGLAIVRL